MKICINHSYQNYFIGEEKLVYFAVPGGREAGSEAMPLGGAETKELNENDFNKKYKEVEDYLNTEAKNALATKEYDLQKKAAVALGQLHEIHRQQIERYEAFTLDKKKLYTDTFKQMNGVIEAYLTPDHEHEKQPVFEHHQENLTEPRKNFQREYEAALTQLNNAVNPYNNNRVAYPHEVFASLYARLYELQGIVEKSDYSADILSATTEISKIMAQTDGVFRERHVALLLQQSVDAALSEPDPDLKKCTTVLMGVFQKPIFADGKIPNGPWEILSNGIRFQVEKNGKVKVADMSDTAMTNFSSIAQEFGTSSSREIAEIENGGPLKA